MSINKRSIKQINNTKDVMCLARAVVVGNTMQIKMILRLGNRNGIILEDQIDLCRPKKP